MGPGDKQGQIMQMFRTLDKVLGDLGAERTRQMKLFEVFEIRVVFAFAVAQVEVIDDIDGVDQGGQVPGGNPENEPLQILTIDLDLAEPGQLDSVQLPDVYGGQVGSWD